MYFNGWCRGRHVSVSELHTQRWNDKTKTTEDQGHLELGTYSNERFNLKTYSLQTYTHTHYFSIISYNTHLHIMYLTEKWCSLCAPDTPSTLQHFAFHAQKFTEGKCLFKYSWENAQKWGVFLCICGWVSISERSYKNDTNTHAL